MRLPVKCNTLFYHVFLSPLNTKFRFRYGTREMINVVSTAYVLAKSCLSPDIVFFNTWFICYSPRDHRDTPRPDGQMQCSVEGGNITKNARCLLFAVQVSAFLLTRSQGPSTESHTEGPHSSLWQPCQRD